MCTNLFSTHTKKGDISSLSVLFSSSIIREGKLVLALNIWVFRELFVLYD